MSIIKAFDSFAIKQISSILGNLLHIDIQI